MIQRALSTRKRWNLAWRQLVETNSFKAGQQQQAIAFGEKSGASCRGLVPRLAIVLKRRKMPPREESTPKPRG